VQARNIEPRHGLWTLPAGFLELGETTEQGALRETDEEAGARIELQGLFTVLNVARVGQVHFFYRARMTATPTSTRAARPWKPACSAKHEIPWDQIAFRTVRETLAHYFDDRRAGQFRLHCADIGFGELCPCGSALSSKPRRERPARLREDLIHPDPLLDCLVEVCRLHGQARRAPRCRPACRSSTAG
jgi:ADP-ribose pyrophosphatase YjhB (NUDIX family)